MTAGDSHKLNLRLFAGGEPAATQARDVQDDVIDSGECIIVSVGRHGTAAGFHLTVASHRCHCRHNGSRHRQNDSINEQISDHADRWCGPLGLFRRRMMTARERNTPLTTANK